VPRDNELIMCVKETQKTLRKTLLKGRGNENNRDLKVVLR